MGRRDDCNGLETQECFYRRDAYAPKYWPQSLIHYLNTYGQDKVLFGTDWPVIDPERAVKEISDLNLRDEPMQKLMRDNAHRVFKL